VDLRRHLRACAWHADCSDLARMWRQSRGRYSFRGWQGLVVSSLLFGCAAPDARLADYRDHLELEVMGTGRESSVAPTDFFAVLKATDAASASDVPCPTFGATVLVNGVELPKRESGREARTLVGVEANPDPCTHDVFALHFGALPSAWLDPFTEIRVSDDSAAFAADVKNLFVGPTLAFPPGTAPELHPQATVTLSFTPTESELVGQYAELTFMADDPDATSATFTVSNGAGTLSVDDHSVTFAVPDVDAARGALVLRARPLGPQLLDCTGFSECSVPVDPDALYSSTPLPAAIVQAP
jgi:hypothetical protein